MGLIDVAALTSSSGHVNAQPVLDAMAPWVNNGLFWALRLVVAGNADGPGGIGPGRVVSPPSEARLSHFSIQGKSSYDWWNPNYGSYHRDILSQQVAALLGALPNEYLNRLLYVQVPIGYQGENTVMQNNLSHSAPLADHQERVLSLEGLGYTDQTFHHTVVTDIGGAWQSVRREFPDLPLVCAINPHGMYPQEELYRLSHGTAGVETRLTVATTAKEMQALGFFFQFDGAGRLDELILPYSPTVTEPYGGDTPLKDVLLANTQYPGLKVALFYEHTLGFQQNRKLIEQWRRQRSLSGDASEPGAGEAKHLS